VSAVMPLQASVASPERFYADLPVFRDVDVIMRPENYALLPDDWHVGLCDVRNSTAAIERGQYKSVNSLGVAAITAVLNAAKGLDIPFSFEGDGCVVCVPPGLLEEVRRALAKTREIARNSFGLDLRAATVPVFRLREAGSGVFVARYQVSPNYVQTVFAGGGISHADRLIKDPASCAEFLLGDDVEPGGSLEGFECRWQDIPSRHGETVSLMVKVLDADPNAAIRRYREVVAKVGEIYGNDEACHPLAVPDLDVSLDGRRLGIEAGIRAADRSWLGRWWWVQRVRLALLAGRFMMNRRVRTAKTDWGRYKDALVRNSDVRKFSDVYRHILAGNTAQREALTAWLEEGYARRELAYGLHVTDRAQMTCLVFDYNDRHLHFVDGADGGLFLAAKAFKERVAKLSGPS
jgi:hypothetical protein